MSPANGIKAIFYDLDGTLHAENPPQLEVFSEHASRLGMQISSEALLSAARWEYYYFGQSEEMRSDRAEFPDEKSFWGNYVRRQLLALGASQSQAEQLEPQLYAYMEQHYRPDDAALPGVHEVLETLKARGYILGLVSNRDNLTDEYLSGFDLAEFFHVRVSADQINARKPEKRIFDHALALAGVEAHEAMHVGDNYFTDVVGARNAGIAPVLLDTRGVFENLDCASIRSHSEMLDLLGTGSASSSDPG